MKALYALAGGRGYSLLVGVIWLALGIAWAFRGHPDQMLAVIAAFTSALLFIGLAVGFYTRAEPPPRR